MSVASSKQAKIEWHHPPSVELNAESVAANIQHRIEPDRSFLVFPHRRTMVAKRDIKAGEPVYYGSDVEVKS